MVSPSRSFSEQPSNRYSYTPPNWAQNAFTNIPPHGRLHLANLPTPLYKLSPSKTGQDTKSLLQLLAEFDISIYIKRDDMTGGVETGGNKIRKLEFLLADALAKHYKAVVTIGGEQSNHCRATAAAARMVGLEPHLILRTKRADEIQSGEGDIGYVGNILFDRMMGSAIYTCTPGEYGRIGSDELVLRLCKHLEVTRGTTAYPIPVGGSNGIGSWGYIEGVDEVLAQWNGLERAPSLDHVVFACGSGGTAAGISLGMALAFRAEHSSPTVHAIGVCDDPDYFYGYCAGIANQMGLHTPDGSSSEAFLRKHMKIHQGKGLGYASSTAEELGFITDFALETGVSLDPVYSGKALYHFITEVLQNDLASFQGKNILFWHTGKIFLLLFASTQV